MTVHVTPPILAPHEAQPSALKVLFWAFWAAVLLRLSLHANVLNLVINYTADAGTIVEKIHPANYLLAAVSLALLSTQRIQLNTRALGIVRAQLAHLLILGVL